MKKFVAIVMALALASTMLFAETTPAVDIATTTVTAKVIKAKKVKKAKKAKAAAAAS